MDFCDVDAAFAAVRQARQEHDVRSLCEFMFAVVMRSHLF